MALRVRVPSSTASRALAVGLYHHRRQVIDPEASAWRAFEPADEQALRDGIARFMPEANGPLLSWRTCIFTNTPDEHFVVDRYPAYPQVILASPCSGHGYKFASVMGEILADMAMDREPAFDLSSGGCRVGPRGMGDLPRVGLRTHLGHGGPDAHRGWTRMDHG
ncbi:MAG: FAD-dependent oxidoreductase [Chloroflexota bacterium]